MLMIQWIQSYNVLLTNDCSQHLFVPSIYLFTFVKIHGFESFWYFIHTLFLYLCMQHFSSPCQMRSMLAAMHKCDITLLVHLFKKKKGRRRIYSERYRQKNLKLPSALLHWSNTHTTTVNRSILLNRFKCAMKKAINTKIIWWNRNMHFSY